MLYKIEFVKFKKVLKNSSDPGSIGHKVYEGWHPKNWIYAPFWRVYQVLKVPT